MHYERGVAEFWAVSEEILLSQSILVVMLLEAVGT